MNVFETIKYGVNCREAAERYGMEVSRYGILEKDQVLTTKALYASRKGKPLQKNPYG